MQWPLERAISSLPEPPNPWFTHLVRRLLPAALATAVLVASFAGVASARLATDAPRAAKPAPFRAPAAQPRADSAQPGAYGFRTSNAIATDFQPAQPAGQPAAGGASASVTITATVLPVVTIVIDGSGDVVELFTNTEERVATDVLYLVRRDSIDGERGTLDADTWADARRALAQAHAGSGSIWSS